MARSAICPAVLETFCDKQRFFGTCYRAANGTRVGQTQGRGKRTALNNMHFQSRTSGSGRCKRTSAKSSTPQTVQAIYLKVLKLFFANPDCKKPDRTFTSSQDTSYLKPKALFREDRIQLMMASNTASTPTEHAIIVPIRMVRD